MTPNNGWAAWQELVIEELRNNKKSVDALHSKVETVRDSLERRISCVQDEVKRAQEGTKKDVDDMFKKDIVPMREAIVGLKVKSGVWGATAGMIPVLIFIMIVFLRSKHTEAKVLTDDVVATAVNAGK